MSRTAPCTSWRLPKGKGTWPAFWMMPDDFSKGWPACGEIDIMEEVGVNPDHTSSSIHCFSYNHVKGTQKTAERLTPGAESEYHVYALEWTEDYIKTYVDGEKLLEFKNDKSGNDNTWPFNKKFYIILNLAWGGDWGGYDGVNESALPCTMQVDYVRLSSWSSWRQRPPAAGRVPPPRSVRPLMWNAVWISSLRK